MKFNNTYLKYKGLYCEGTIKSLLPIIQNEIFRSFGVNTYAQLNSEQKQKFNDLLNKETNIILSEVDQITTNKQYQSWLYDIMKADYELHLDINKTKKLIDEFQQITKSPKLSSKQRDITSYQSIEQLTRFVRQFKAENTKYKNIEYFNKIYSNDKYDLYLITSEDKQEFQDIYGSNGYNVGWCVVNTDNIMFESYTSAGNNLYLCTFKNSSKPFGLISVGYHEIKDIHNEPIQSTDLDFINCVYQALKDVTGEIYIDTDDDIIYTLQKHSKNDFEFYIPYIIEKIYGTSINKINQNFLFYIRYPEICKYDKQTNTLNGTDTILSEHLKPYVKDGLLTVNFNNCSRNFDCSGLQLNSLKGVPKKVSGSFICNGNYIKSFEDGPEIVEGSYNAGYNMFLESLKGVPNKVRTFVIEHCYALTSLQYGPKIVDKIYKCNDCNSIKTLEGAPKQCDYFNCSWCDNLQSLKGSPQYITRAFDCSNCKRLETLEGNNFREVKHLSFEGCHSLTSLDGLNGVTFNTVITPDQNLLKSTDL